MGYVTQRKARIQTQLATVQAQIDALNDAITEMAATGVKSYAFDSGEGSQKTTYRSYSEIMSMISELEAKESHLINELYRMGNVAVRFRRYPC